MIHDPLCPWVGIPPHFCTTTANIEYASPAACWCKEGDIPCLCSLIAEVRADTIDRMAQSVKAVRADERQRIIGVMERNADGDAIKVIDAVLDML